MSLQGMVRSHSSLLGTWTQCLAWGTGRARDSTRQLIFPSICEEAQLCGCYRWQEPVLLLVPAAALGYQDWFLW